MTGRLLWIHQNYVHHTQAGNGRAGFALRALTDAGWQVDLIAGTQSYFGDAAEEGVQVDHDGRLRIHRIASGNGEKGSQYATFSQRSVRRARKLPRPDVIFASTPPLPQLAPALAMSAWWRAPVVLEVRDLWPAFLLEGGMLQPGPMVAALRCLESTALHHCEEAVVVGPAYEPYVHAMGVPSDRITVAPTGAVMPKPNPQAATTWREQQGLQGKTIALYAGSFNEAYDLHVLLHAAATCERDDIAWVFAGNGRARAAVEQAAATNEQIIDLGSLPRDELETVLAAADVGLLPHADWPLLGITISGKLFEYMAHKLAVVCLRDGTMGEIVRQSGCGVVLDVPSAEHVRAAVERYADDPDRRKVGQRGRQWVEAHVQADEMARNIHSAVERCRQVPQRRRLVRSTLRGVFDGLRNRGDRVLNEQIRPDTVGLARTTLSAWLSGRKHT